VLYHGSGLPVSGAAVHVDGPTPGVVQTDGNGLFALTAQGGTAWGVQPQKMGDTGNAITAADAVVALQAAVGVFTPDGGQQMACDVTGDGRITSTDALLMLYYKVGLISAFPVTLACSSDWAFMPNPASALNQQVAPPVVGGSSCQLGAIDWMPLADNVANQDFSAVLFGDCSGNWRPSTGSSVPGRVPGSDGTGVGRGTVRVGAALASSRTGRVRLPLYVQAASPYHSLDLQLSYDATRLRLLGVRRVAQARRALTAVNQRAPGVLSVSLASADPLRSGAVAVVEFQGRAAEVGPALRVASAIVGEK